MKVYLWTTGAFEAPQFKRLQAVLGSKPKDRMMVMGHLGAWHEEWAGSDDLDSGVFFGVTEEQLGRWSGWPDAAAFGRALVEAGYVEPLAARYPRELLLDANGKLLSGYVAVGIDGRPELEWNWPIMYDEDPAKAKTWCIFLIDNTLRWAACEKLDVPVEQMAKDGRLPWGWAHQFRARDQMYAQYADLFPLFQGSLASTSL